MMVIVALLPLLFSALIIIPPMQSAFSENTSIDNTTTNSGNYAMTGNLTITSASIIYSTNRAEECPLNNISSNETASENQTEKLNWFVQEKPQCSDVILYTTEQLKAMGVKINNFRSMDSDVMVCLSCDFCPDDYLLVLTDDKQSKSILLDLGFMPVDDLSKYP
jgi:hypothetical protein